MESSGSMVLASDKAFLGSGWHSKKTAWTPAATAARARSGARSGRPPVCSPAPGSCVECVQSKQIGGGAGRGTRRVGFQFHQVAQAEEVVDEPPVAEGGAAFGEEDVGATGFGELPDGSGHLVGGEELALFDVDGAGVPGGGLSGGAEEVGLAAEEGGDLKEVDDAGGGVGLLGGVDVGGGGDGELLLDLGHPGQALLEAGPAG